MFPPLVIFLVWEAAHSPAMSSVFCVPVAEEEGGTQEGLLGKEAARKLFFQPKVGAEQPMEILSQIQAGWG